jgi:hypothetical protein
MGWLEAPPNLTLAGRPARIGCFRRRLGQENFMAQLWVIMILGARTHLVRVWVQTRQYYGIQRREVDLQ